MRIVPAIEYELRRAIRDARALDRLISVVGLQPMLEKKFGRTFVRPYVSKLLHKVARETIIESDRT